MANKRLQVAWARIQEHCGCPSHHSGERYAIWLSGPDVAALRRAASRFSGSDQTLGRLVPADDSAVGLLSYPTEQVARLPEVAGQFTLGFDDIAEIRSANQVDSGRMGGSSTEMFVGLPYELQNRLRTVLQKRRLGL